MLDQNDVLRLKALVKEISDILSRYDDSATQPTPAPTLPPVQPAITSLVIETDEKSVPITWGQVFKIGEVQPNDQLMARWPDGSTSEIQVDVKATHADGSVRHAIISTIAVPGKLELVKGLPKNFVTGLKTMHIHYVKVVVGDVEYLAGALGEVRWLDGPIVTEYNTSAPLLDTNGKAHPHLHVRFAVRSYAGEGTRVDVTVENNWAYEPGPQNFTYDVQIAVGDKVVYEQKALTHYHHSRWRKVFWAGRDEPKVNIRHDPKYIIETAAVPNYDTSLVIPEKVIAAWDAKWKKAGDAPMTVGLSVKGMATTGGRPDIAILPQWSVLALLSGDKRLMDATHGTAELAGSWSMHYRDKDTDKPISLIDYPYMTILGNKGDTKNPNKIDPATGKKGVYEAFPAVPKAEKSPFSHDSSHQPGFSYFSYLLTGDLYHLEELQFWAMWNVFSTNPGYRKNVQGLLWRQQVRAIAWSIRTLAQAAYITPDADPLKKDFAQIMDSNLDYGVKTFVEPPNANELGAYTGEGALVYGGGSAIAPFQDDFLTASLNYVYELGFKKAEPLLVWKSKFVAKRLLDTNWLAAVNYTWPVKATIDGPEFKTIGEAYDELLRRLDDEYGKTAKKIKEDKANLARIKSGGKDLGGYPASVEGFAANAQPAVAAAARYWPEAWEKFEQRDPKPKYETGPQFAILPRTV